MTDSTIDTKPGEGGLEVGPSTDELFGAVEEEPLEEDRTDRDSEDGEAETIEDRTATDVFDELRAEATAGTGAADLLADESPEEIIASADEPAEPSADVDDDLLADDEALENLLLTGRTEGEEFLWVDAGDEDGDDAALETPVNEPAETEADASTEAEPASDEDGETVTDERAADDATRADSPSIDGDTSFRGDATESDGESETPPVGGVDADPDNRPAAEDSSDAEDQSGLFARLRSLPVVGRLL